MSSNSNQVALIHSLSNILNEAEIEHHFDGSTARFIQSDADSMDDIDIVFPFDTLELVKKLFENKEIVEEIWDDNLKLHHFKFYENNEEVHLLFYKDGKNSFYDYHELVDFAGIQVWVKGMSHFKK